MNAMQKRPRERVLIVDGYNVLNAWRSNLNNADTLADARDELARRLPWRRRGRARRRGARE